MREKIISKLLRIINKVEKIDEDRIKYNSEYFLVEAQSVTDAEARAILE